MKGIPEYVGIQQNNNDLGDLLNQFNEVNNAIAEKMSIDNQVVKNEYLNRFNSGLEPIMEATNEYTYPSGLQNRRDK